MIDDEVRAHTTSEDDLATLDRFVLCSAGVRSTRPWASHSYKAS